MGYSLLVFEFLGVFVAVVGCVGSDWERCLVDHAEGEDGSEREKGGGGIEEEEHTSEFEVELELEFEVGVVEDAELNEEGDGSVSGTDCI